MTPHTHCHACGEGYTELTWPRKCEVCNAMAFRNPLPVVVALIPIHWKNPGSVVIKHNPRLLGVERVLAPQGLALPGGFVDYGETWQEAAAREVLEETGIEFNPENVREYKIKSAPDGTLLIFVKFPALLEEDLDLSFKSDETASLRILEMGDAQNLVFGIHAEMAEEWILDNRPAGSDYWGVDEKGKAIFTFPM